MQVFDEDLGAPPHLAGASAAAAEYAASSDGRVNPQDVEKVRWVRGCMGGFLADVILCACVADVCAHDMCLSATQECHHFFSCFPTGMCSRI